MSRWRREASGLETRPQPCLVARISMAWGAEVRARLVLGPVAGVFGAGYWPRQQFAVGAFEGALTRVPGVVGVGVRAMRRPIDLRTDMAVVMAFETYEGLSPHTPREASRLSPGLEAALIATTPTWAGFAPLVGVRVAWMPITQNLVALPQLVGPTPTWWLSGAVGFSWAP